MSAYSTHTGLDDGGLSLRRDKGNVNQGNRAKCVTFAKGKVMHSLHHASRRRTNKDPK